MPAATTVLSFSGLNVPPYSARGLTQTLEPIAQKSQLRRTVNGSLVDLSAPQFKKYRSTISCRDMQAPAFSGLWQGTILTVDCVAELAYLTASGSPERTVVSSRTDGDYTFYRPRLTMRVVSFNTVQDEYQAEVGWDLSLEEV